jgi:hypothetical protein
MPFKKLTPFKPSHRSASYNERYRAFPGLLKRRRASLDSINGCSASPVRSKGRDRECFVL